LTHQLLQAPLVIATRPLPAIDHAHGYKSQAGELRSGAGEISQTQDTPRLEYAKKLSQRQFLLSCAQVMEYQRTKDLVHTLVWPGQLSRIAKLPFHLCTLLRTHLATRLI